jgi:hypothetical protein
MNTDAELHSPVRGQVGVPGSNSALDLDSAAGRVKGTRKLGEEVIPWRINHPAPMLAD